MQQPMPRVERSIWLPAPVDVVWAHVTNGAFAQSWFDGNVQIDCRAGGEVYFDPGDGEVQWGTVEEVVDGRRLQWSWRTDDGDPSLVIIEMASEDDGTLLTVSEELLPYVMRTYPMFGGDR